MTHAALFAILDYQTGERGEDAFTSTNWFMVMAHRPLGPGQLGIRAMLSAEPVTVDDDGYPLLLQNGEGLVDHQHPHDLVMELAGEYSLPVSRDVGLQLYAGVVGEPALGPVTFHHRHSASADPASPLGHHWMDSTHITSGVVTGGVFTETFKLEASWFNGRESDDNRTDLDLDTLDSGSVRLSVNPAPDLSMQVSGGRLDGPEEDEPGVSVVRTTASVTGTGSIGPEGSWSATAIWGRNDPSEGEATNAFLLEGTFVLDSFHTVFGRAEWVQKSGHDLAAGPPGETFQVPSLSAGYLYTFTELQDQEVAFGIRVTANFIESDLREFYGDEIEWGFLLYIRVQPGRISDSAAPRTRR
jgi:hypothetical protein